MKGQGPETPSLTGPSNLCRYDGYFPSDVLIIADSRASLAAHRELFRFNEEVYLVSESKGIIEVMKSIRKRRPRSLHVSGGWGWLLRLSLWKEEISWGDMLILLKDAGMNREELMPFRDSPPGDIFPSLYYGKRFEVLRRLCRRARKNLEEKPDTPPLRADFHLVEPTLSQIVASSL
jgi:hypothetical protein